MKENKASLIRVMLKDIIDFFIIFFLSFMLVMFVYINDPAMEKTVLSLYFFEQFVEVFFLNPILLVWLLFFGLIITIAYFTIMIPTLHATLGAFLIGIRIVSYQNNANKIMIGLRMAIGSYFGVLLLFISPLMAWWFAKDHKGLSENLGSVYWRRVYNKD